MHQRWWSREQRRTIPPAWMQDDSSKSRRRSRRIYFPVPLLSDSRTGNAVDVAPGMRESLPSFVRARREEERTGWRIKQRAVNRASKREIRAWPCLAWGPHTLWPQRLISRFLMAVIVVLTIGIMAPILVADIPEIPRNDLYPRATFFVDPISW